MSGMPSGGTPTQATMAFMFLLSVIPAKQDLQLAEAGEAAIFCT
jgi:hypothetical protein